MVYDYLGNPVSNPYWISCTGGPYTLNFESPSSFGSYTISWGDSSSDDTGTSYTANSIISHTYASTVDTFVVKLYVPSLSCTLTGVVVMEEPVVANITSGITTACAPAVLQFTNSSTNVSKTTKFTWKFGDGSVPSVLSYTNGGSTVAHTYTAGSVNCQTMVTLSAQNYCSMGSPSTATVNPIQIFNKDVANIGTTSMLRCWPDNSFTFTNTSTQNCSTQGNTFQRKEQWNFGDNWGKGQDSIVSWANWPPATPVSISYTSTGTYTVTLLDSNFCGVSTKTISVTISNAPTASFVVLTPTLCQNSSISFNNVSSIGYFYRWDFGNSGGIFVNKPYGLTTHTYVSPGTYTVKLVAFVPGGAGSCTDTTSQVITVLPSPTSNFVFTPTVGCNSLSNVSFTDGSTGATNWNWNFGNGNTSTLQVVPAQNYTTAGTYSISLTVTGSNGCQAINTQTLQVHHVPVPAFSPTFACLGSAISFTDQSTVGGSSPIINWEWSFGDGSPLSGIQNPSHTYTLANTYTVLLRVGTAFCSDSIKKTVTVGIKPNATFAFTQNGTCPPVVCNFNNFSTGATSYSWNFGVTPTATSSVNSPSFAFTNTTTGTATYTVTLIAINSSGCSDTASQPVMVSPKPVAAFLSNTIAACTPINVTFTNTSTGASDYSWLIGTSATSTLTNPAHTFTTNNALSNTTFTIRLVATNTLGCSDTTYNYVTLFPKPNPGFTVDTPACHGKTLTFTNQSAGTSLNHNWNFGNGSTSSSVSPTQTYSNTSGSSQTYTVKLIVTNSNNCSDSIKVPVVIRPKPNYSVALSPDSGCTNLRVNFSGISGVTNYTWSFGDGNSSITPNPQNTYTNTGTSTVTFSVQLIAADANGCIDTAYRQVKVFPKPIASFQANPVSVYLNNSPVNFTNLSSGHTSSFWRFGDGNTSIENEPSHSYQQLGSFQPTLIVTSNKGCKDTFALAGYIEVIEEETFKMPNAFTPNISASNGGKYNASDLDNNVFHPTITGDVENYQLSVYSRWGELLFDSKDVNTGWDGYYKDKLCDQDVYVWQLKFTMKVSGTSYNKTGDVLLLK